MPVNEFGVDAAVLYADIMLPLEGMGVSLEIQPDLGPIIHNPIRSMQDVNALRLIDPRNLHLSSCKQFDLFGVSWRESRLLLVFRVLLSTGLLLN